MENEKTLKDLEKDAVEDQQEFGHCDICENPDRRYWGLCESCYDEMHESID